MAKDAKGHGSDKRGGSSRGEGYTAHSLNRALAQNRKAVKMHQAGLLAAIEQMRNGDRDAGYAAYRKHVDALHSIPH